MPWPQHLRARVKMNYRKGFVKKVPGEMIEMQDPNGKTIASGFALKVLTVRDVQPDLSKAQYAEAAVLVEKGTGDKLKSFKIQVPVSELCTNLKGVITAGVGADAVFLEDDPYDALLQVILAHSVRPDTAPTYTTPSWMEPDGWYVRGKKVLSTPVEINRETRDPESNGALYILRAPRLNGEGWEYSKPVTWNQLVSGDYKFSDGRSITPIDPTLAFMAISERWDGLTPNQKDSQRLEERDQPAKDKERARNRAFGFRDWDALSR
jgi:hypothetical protein